MDNRVLTLQEKMVRIRARIPSLVKQAYSEEVSYDFVKIDDIFRYLTPAMNEYGVNFDILSESATKKDERGNPMFVEFLPLYQMWIYEADLTFRWTNGENPEDQFQVTAHAIGFHQMPEKAKGSGWTYCLKYYLLNKFCINQGGDDPDMRNVAPTSDVAQGEMAGPLDGEWSYENENGYSQGNDMEPAAFREPEGGFQEAQEFVGNGAVFGQVPGDAEGEVIDGLQEAAGGFQNGEGMTEEQSGEMTEGYLSGEPEGYSVNQSIIGPDQGTMVTLPESAGEPLNSAETSSVNGKPNANGSRNTQGGSQSAPGNAANPTNPIQPPVNTMGSQGGMTVEEASNVICNCGLYRGKTLGEIARSGEDGIQNLKWFVNSYRGRNEELRIGARVLLEAAMAA